MRERLWNLYNKYREYVLYVAFGMGTTVINLVTYKVLYSLLNVENLVSTFIAWLTATAFAFLTNRIVVFRSSVSDPMGKTREVAEFFICRILTGAMEMVIMRQTVDIWALNSTLSKLIASAFAAVVNYLVSRFMIFTKRKEM